jgi:hypothetical protein
MAAETAALICHRPRNGRSTLGAIRLMDAEGGSSNPLLDATTIGGEAAAIVLASPAERPIHLGAIQLETLNLPRLFFEQVICVCE